MGLGCIVGPIGSCYFQIRSHSKNAKLVATMGENERILFVNSLGLTRSNLSSRWLGSDLDSLETLTSRCEIGKARLESL